MDIAVIGGGLTGLTAAYELTKRGHRVTVFEKESSLGGLAYGFKQPNWDWHMEGAYHHLFTNDRYIISLLEELGLSERLIRKRPITANLLPPNSKLSFEFGDGVPIVPLDSPTSLLRFPTLSLLDKVRTAALLGFLKLNPYWQPLEGITAEQLLISIGGNHAYKTIWEPLLYGKFGTYAPRVAASWFWARIKKRTPRLCYIRGGFHTLITALAQEIKHQGGHILPSKTVTSVQRESGNTYYVSWSGAKKLFDKVLFTIPTPLVTAILPILPHTYTLPLRSIPHLSAQTLILETDRPILKNVYWLNVTDRSFPFLAAVAHTNFMDRKHYGNHHLTYFGNYLPPDHPYLSLSEKELLSIFLPFIRRIASDSKFKIKNLKLFVAPFAQPVHERHYSQNIPPIATPLPGIYLANMDYIYPWDRGTNYAVELGMRAARTILQ